MSTKDTKWVLNIPTEFTNEDIDYIVCGAIEGGINYWVESIKTGEDRVKGVPLSEHVSKVLFEGGEVTINDDEGHSHTLTLAKILRGIQLHHSKNPSADKENYDAGDYDSIIQLALFEKMVYG